MKKRILILSFILAFPIFFYSCDELLGGDTALTEAEVIDGLKKALKIGADTSCTVLNKNDAYFKNQIIKILLPPEGDVILESMKSLPAYVQTELNAKIDDVVLTLNRSAEFAAIKAKPIFVDAITNMTVTDGMKILYGKNFADSNTTAFDSTAATHYLNLKTRANLTTVFSPIIDSALDESLVKGFSANDAWANLVTAYNYYAVLILHKPAMEQVSLGEHATKKALDGLFYVVGNEEKKIRLDPFQWADDILQKVFSSVAGG